MKYHYLVRSQRCHGIRAPIVVTELHLKSITVQLLDYCSDLTTTQTTLRYIFG